MHGLQLPLSRCLLRKRQSVRAGVCIVCDYIILFMATEGAGPFAVAPSRWLFFHGRVLLILWRFLFCGF